MSFDLVLFCCVILLSSIWQSCVPINIILLSIVLLSFILIGVVLSVVLPNVAVSHERAPSVSPKKVRQDRKF